MNRNIMQLCLSPDLGGLELYVQKISTFLNSKVNVTAVINEKGKLTTAFKENNLKYITINKPSKIPLLTAKKLAKIIDKNNIDVIHIHWTKDIPLAVLAKLFSQRKPKLVQSRHMTMTRFKSDFYHKFLYKNIDMMIAVTRQVKEQIKKYIPSDVCPKVQTLYIGAKTPTVITDEEKTKLKAKYGLKNFTVGIVGRIEDGKGQYLLIDAIKQLKEKSIDAQALIVGHAMTENYLNSLKESIKKDGIEENIIFTGFTTQVQKLMQICDVIVLATHKETFGLVLIEAMQCGTAVMGSNSGGPLEIIEDTHSGLLFESKNSSDLSQKIEQLIQNTQLKDTLAKQGQFRAQEMFEEQKQFEDIFSLLKGLK